MPRLCKQCNDPLPNNKPKNKFCNHSCAASYTNTARSEKRSCSQCGDPLGYHNKKFCSHKCQRDHQFINETKPKVVSGLVSDRLTLKRFLIREEGEHCSSCSLTEWLGEPLSLELDHIDGDASHNLPENIRLLCPNCHSITPTWKGRNKGNGRKSRDLSLT